MRVHQLGFIPFFVAGFTACASGKSEREKFGGSGMKGAVDFNADTKDPGNNPGKGDGDATNQTPNKGNSNQNGGGGGQGSGGVSGPNVPTPSAPSPSPTGNPPPSPTPAPPSPTPPPPPAPKAVGLEECTAQKKAWPAVVNQKQPTQCGDSLVDWCCSRTELKARFPTMAQTLEDRFRKHIDTDQFVLYHCSYDPTGSPQKGPKYTMHFAKIVEPQVFYQPIHIYDLIPVTPVNPQNPCPPQVDTNGLKKPPTLPGPDFVTTVKPIIDAKCGGTRCHSSRLLAQNLTLQSLRT